VDLSGSGNDFVAVNGVPAPTWVANGPNLRPSFYFTAGGGLQEKNAAICTGTSWNKNFTIFIVYQFGTSSTSAGFSTSNGIVFSSTNSVNNGINLGKFGIFGNWGVGNGYGELSCAAETGEGNAVVTSFSGAGIGGSGNPITFEDGFPETYFGSASQGIQNPLLCLGNAVPGNYLYGLNGYISEVIIYNRCLTAAEYNQVNGYLLSKYKPTSAPLLLVDGDSISSVEIGCPLQVTGLYSFASMATWDIRASAYGGKTIEQDQAASPFYTSTFDGRHLTNVALLWLSANDVAIEQASTMYANFVAQAGVLRSAGYRVIAATCLPQGSTAIEANRQAFNTALRANWRTFADALVDWEVQVPNMGTYSTNLTNGNLTATGSNNYLTYSPVHPSPTGYSQLMPALVQTINGFYPTLSGTNVIGQP
jgi:hypothetical protein